MRDMLIARPLHAIVMMPLLAGTINVCVPTLKVTTDAE
jgi:hypothetical protein